MRSMNSNLYKFLAGLEDHSLSPDNYLRLKVPTVTQYEMSLLHCDVAEKTALTYIYFFFFNHSLFSSLQTEVHDS